MKKSVYIIALVSLCLLGSCDLDREIQTDISPQYAYRNFDYTMMRANGLYGPLLRGFKYIDDAMMASATDEAEFVVQWANVQNFNQGSWSERLNPDNKWGHYFDAIRRCNLFLENCDNVDFDQWKMDPDENQQIIYRKNLAKLENRKKEARFLRAFYHFELMKRYGGIPVMDRTYSLKDDYAGLSRRPLKDVIDFIAGECKELAGDNGLPVSYEENLDYGRITKGAALALRSRVLLYAASDLYNNPTWARGYEHPELISLTGDRRTKWAEAAQAAKDLILMPESPYTLCNDYSKIGKDANISELILFRIESQSNDLERTNYPIGYVGGGTGNMPSGNLVDAYQKLNGEKFDWTKLADKEDPYADRDPRLKMSIITNNDTYKGRPVEIWEGGKDGQPIERSTRTGYYLKKFLDENINLLENGTSVHVWPYFRLAEIYLNYAEALNECDPGNADIKKYVDMVRERQNVGMPGMAVTEQGDVREFIRNERRIELAFEDHRAWDTRRWMIADKTENLKLRGVKIVKSPTGFVYQPSEVETRVFEPKMYFYPIPLNEINVTGWSQNPLW